MTLALSIAAAALTFAAGTPSVRVDPNVITPFAVTTQFFNTTGSILQWNWPAGVTTVTAEVMGAGGNGGTASGNPATGGGGKGGCYCKGDITKGAEAFLEISIGANGGTDTFVRQGGVQKVSSGTVANGATAASASTNGAGGSTTGGTRLGTVQNLGGNGGTGTFTAGTGGSGGGGGAAGPGGAGGAASGFNRGLANTGLWADGVARLGNGASGVPDTTAGVNGDNYGGGGSGGKANTNPDKLGGNGAQGCVLLSWNDVPITLTPAAASMRFTPQLVADANLQGLWLMEEASGSRFDTSGRGNALNDINTVGQSATAKRGLYSAQFIRANSEMLARADANLSANFPGKLSATTRGFTIGCWVQMASIANRMWAVNKGTDGAYTLFYDQTPQKFRAELNDGGTYKGVYSTGTYTALNTWIHLALRVDGADSSRLSLWVNGVNQGSILPGNAILATDTGDFAIGAFSGGNHYWDGLIDEVFAFDRTLTDAEIVSIYQRGITGTPPVVTISQVIKLTPAAAVLTLSPGTPTVIAGVSASGYRYYHALAVDRTKVAADQTNFPVLVSVDSPSLRAVAFGGKIQRTVFQAGGGNNILIPADLVFSSDSAGANRYPWEVEAWDQSTGNLIVWVKLPTVSASTDTPFFLAFGNAAVTTQQNTGSFAPANVWDANYKAVYHLAGAPSLSGVDSVSGGFGNGIINGAVTGVGKIQNGASFDGATAYIDLQNAGTHYSNVSTVEAWIKPGATPITGNIFTKGFQSVVNITEFSFGVGDGKVAFSQYSTPTGSQGISASVATLSVGVWYHLVGTRDGAAWALYINGVLDSTASEATVFSNASNWGIGANLTNGFGVLEFFNGLIDEARFSNTARSATWVATEYNSQNTPGNIGSPGFVVYGPETDTTATNVAPATKALALTPGTPIVTATSSGTTILQPATKALSLSPATPTLKSTVRLQPATKALAITPVAPTLKSTVRLQPATKALALSPATPVLKSTVRLQPASKALTLTPGTPALKATVRVAPALKALAITAATPALKTTTTLTPASKALAFTGTVSALRSTIRPVVRSIVIAPGVPAVVVLSPTGLHPATRALFLSPATPTIRTITVLHPAAATLTLAPRTSTLRSTIGPISRALAITPATPTLRATLRPATRALTFLAGTPTVFVSSSNALHPASRALTFTAGTPVLRTITVLRPTTRALNFTLQLPALRTTTRPGSAALNLTRYTPTIRIAAVGQRTQPMVTIA